MVSVARRPRELVTAPAAHPFRFVPSSTTTARPRPGRCPLPCVAGAEDRTSARSTARRRSPATVRRCRVVWPTPAGTASTGCATQPELLARISAERLGRSARSRRALRRRHVGRGPRRRHRAGDVLDLLVSGYGGETDPAVWRRSSPASRASTALLDGDDRLAFQAFVRDARSVPPSSAGLGSPPAGEDDLTRQTTQTCSSPPSPSMATTPPDQGPGGRSVRPPRGRPGTCTPASIAVVASIGAADEPARMLPGYRTAATSPGAAAVPVHARRVRRRAELGPGDAANWP